MLSKRTRRPAPPFWCPGRMLYLGLCSLPFLCIATGAQTTLGQNPLSDPTLRGLQSTFLTAPIERFYLDAPDAQETTVHPEDLVLDSLFIGTNQRIYTKPAQVRNAIASNHALAAFLRSPQFGDALRENFRHAILYAGLPQRGQLGFNEFNAPPMPANVPLGQRAIVRSLRRELRGKAASAPITGNTVSASPEVTGSNATKSGGAVGFLGDIHASPTPTSGVKPAADSVQAQLQERAAQARRSFPHDLTAFVSVSPNGQQATLYVLGALPALPNTEAPMSFTVEAKQYGPQASQVEEASASDQRPTPTLIDKQTLTPADPSGTASRYFCFAYPLTTPPQGGQMNLFVNYWIDPSMAYTYGIALSRSTRRPVSDAASAASWIAIPMTRLQRFQKDFRYTLLRNTEIGEPILLTNLRNK